VTIVVVCVILEGHAVRVGEAQLVTFASVGLVDLGDVFRAGKLLLFVETAF
jgi:hypothetical protein